MKRFILGFLAAFTLASVLMLTSCPAPDVDDGMHEHIFSDGFNSDESTHWHSCRVEGCTDTKDKAAHSFGDWVMSLEPTAETEGERSAVCFICGYKKVEKLPALGDGGESEKPDGGNESVAGGVSESVWKKAFVFDNVRIGYTSISGGEETYTSYEVYGEDVKVKSDDGIYYTDASIFEGFGFPDNYSDFRYTGTDYIAEAVKIGDDDLGIELEFSDVRVVIADGLLVSVEYTIDLGVLGDIKEKYEFSDYGFIKFTVPEETPEPEFPETGSMSKMEYQAAAKKENFKNFAFTIIETNDALDYSLATGAMVGNDCYISVDGYRSESGNYEYTEYGSNVTGYAPELLAEILALLGKIEYSSLVYDADFGQYYYDGMVVFDGFAISGVYLSVEESKLTYIEYMVYDNKNYTSITATFSEYGTATIPVPDGANTITAAKQKELFSDSVLSNVTVNIVDTKTTKESVLMLADGKYYFEQYFGSFGHAQGSGSNSYDDEVFALLKFMRGLSANMIEVCYENDGVGFYRYVGCVTYKGVPDRELWFETQDGKIWRIIIGQYEYTFSDLGSTVI